MKRRSPRRPVRRQDLEAARAKILQERKPLVRRSRRPPRQPRPDSYFPAPASYAQYPGEELEIDHHGYVWQCRIGPAEVLPDGTRVRPLKSVCLGTIAEVFGEPEKRPVGADDQKPRLFENKRKKTPEIVAEEQTARPIPHAGAKNSFFPFEGRPQKELPEGLLRQLAQEGLGADAIARRLREQGIKASVPTIRKRLATLMQPRLLEESDG